MSAEPPDTSKPGSRPGRPPSASPSGRQSADRGARPEPRGPGGGRGRRRRRKPVAPVDVAVRAIAQTTAEPLVGQSPKLADDPLTPREIADMKRHLRLLRQYRKELNLKVNAQEDLLLNERREPSHRGVCQHLLGKVDRKRVFAAAERMPPSEAIRLVEGVLAIAPDVDYVLLFLDCLRRAGDRAQAVAALSEALERIDFAQSTPGQMRRVLDLIVELFDARSLPQMLIGLFEGAAFRRAFDAVAPELPPALARLVVPLRAAQGVLLHGRPSPSGAGPLREGLRLLLHGEATGLGRYPAPVRRRLLELGADAWAGRDEAATRTLLSLLDGLQAEPREHGPLGLQLARALLGREREPEARRLLGQLAQRHPDVELPRRWLRWLDAPRLGSVALIRERAPKGRDAPHQQGLSRPQSGVDLRSLRPVWVYFAPAAEAADLQATARHLDERCLPGLAAMLGRGERGDEAWLALESAGSPLPELLERRGGLEREESLAILRDATGILATLAVHGLSLPDAHPRRFEIGTNGRAWLVDPRGLATTSDAEILMLAHARSLTRQILDGARRFLAPVALDERLPAVTSFAELWRHLT